MGNYLKLTFLNDMTFAKDSEKYFKKSEICFSFNFFWSQYLSISSYDICKQRKNQTLFKKENGIMISIIVLKLGTKLCNMRKK